MSKWSRVKRLSDKALDRLIMDEDQCGWTELMRELHRARAMELEHKKQLKRWQDKEVERASRLRRGR